MVVKCLVKSIALMLICSIYYMLIIVNILLLIRLLVYFSIPGFHLELQSHQVLVHYDKKKEVILSTDASTYGVGAVLSPIMEDDSEWPIAYYSRSMSLAETRYSTLDNEELAIVCGVKRFLPIYVCM